MAKIIAFPAERKPTSSSNVQYWTSGGPVEYILPTACRINGTYRSYNGYNTQDNFDATREGNIFASSEGFKSVVYTSSDSQRYSQHFIGNPGIGAYNGSEISGPSIDGSYVENNATSSWIQGVKGFICEVSDIPWPNDGSSAADGCGGCNQFRISGVFIEPNGRTRVIDMCAGGTKITGHTWNTRPSSRGWFTMSYYCSTFNEMLNWYLIGWAINFGHKRFCGGGGKNKHCTGRIRYLQPLISKENGGPLYTGTPDRYAVCGRGRNWTYRNNGAILTV